MNRRLAILLALLAAIGTLLILDRPRELQMVEVSEQAPRIARTTPPVSVAAPLGFTDAPVPDLFAHPVAAPAPPDKAEAEVPQVATRPFTLVGLRQDGNVRVAYLERSGNGDVASVRAGDLVDGRYRVLGLHDESVHIKDKRSGASIRIGFKDQP